MRLKTYTFSVFAPRHLNLSSMELSLMCVNFDKIKDNKRSNCSALSKYLYGITLSFIYTLLDTFIFYL